MVPQLPPMMKLLPTEPDHWLIHYLLSNSSTPVPWVVSRFLEMPGMEPGTFSIQGMHCSTELHPSSVAKRFTQEYCWGWLLILALDLMATISWGRAFFFLINGANCNLGQTLMLICYTLFISFRLLGDSFSTQRCSHYKFQSQLVMWPHLSPQHGNFPPPQTRKEEFEIFRGWEIH